jgi:hypothetical protein
MAMSPEDGTPSRSPSFHLSQRRAFSLLDGDLTGVPVPLRGSTTQRPPSGFGPPTPRRHSRKHHPQLSPCLFFFARSNRCLPWLHCAPPKALRDRPIMSTYILLRPTPAQHTRSCTAADGTISLQRMQRPPKSPWHLRNTLIAWLYSRSNLRRLHVTCRRCARAWPFHSSLHFL